MIVKITQKLDQHINSISKTDFAQEDIERIFMGIERLIMLEAESFRAIQNPTYTTKKERIERFI